MKTAKEVALGIIQESAPKHFSGNPIGRNPHKSETPEWHNHEAAKHEADADQAESQAADANTDYRQGQWWHRWNRHKEQAKFHRKMGNSKTPDSHPWHGLGKVKESLDEGNNRAEHYGRLADKHGTSHGIAQDSAFEARNAGFDDIAQKHDEVSRHHFNALQSFRKAAVLSRRGQEDSAEHHAKVGHEHAGRAKKAESDVEGMV